ncbi:MAG: tRNA (adenosine(37)-N6)-threonylcarbamoyltransferase complex ATPase subunit type 1 TsaE [Candidatus Abyssobacteria bacterium SURF_5]|uniref:tRNA threonylcarbamoyladenosine biosynthesis protein TsaE n=1 Tax=Abyssobacteria bacterium (strain SURF_5) TaxID=2093360 RepID=A0A3A4NST9_ABYX5|nr:MAG: tRNA (adenosine(37)-N6)-threonylcarbamoyltransferase complex ATPase subunit type 1 TsaE [Candidatus Abyssubacteria bacterium SURF_5]
MRLLSNSPDDTRQIGKLLGRLLRLGDVVALAGRLGSGKTVLTQGLAEGLDVDPDEYVSSPSFTIVNEYRGRTPIFHVDIYRLQGQPEMVALGYEEYFDPRGVTIIEWADKVRDLLPERHVLIEFQISGAERRELTVTLAGDWPPEIAAEVQKVLQPYQRER